MKKIESEYEIDKQKRKQRLVRNEFLYNGESVGAYDMPLIRKQDIDVEKIQLLCYADARNGDEKNKDKTIHFFTYDWKFGKVYDNPDEELEKLGQYYALFSPDFSVFTNMPLALQIESVFKNRWCGAFWQSRGLRVIPTVSWGDERSFDFCFDGIEEGSAVVVCTYCRENCEEDFMLGYNEMMKRIKPSVVLCYDEPFPAMTGNIKEFLPTAYEWTKNLNWEDLAQFKWEKHNRNVSGLDAKKFKFFKYDDPYKKDEIVKCPVCGGVALQDRYGNGECENCGWKFEKDADILEKQWGISYPMLVSTTTAKKQYEQGLPFKATFDEFVNGLYFYSEMLFTYENVSYEVFLKGSETVVFCSEDMQQEYGSREEFEAKANIDGVLLKDLWADVSFAGFMYCG